MPLPPRKWYSLQQAAEKLTRDLKEPVTVDDLIYYACDGKLQLCTYITYIENKAINICNNLIKLDEKNKIRIPKFNKRYFINSEGYEFFSCTCGGFDSDDKVKYMDSFTDNIEVTDFDKIYFGFTSFVFDVIVKKNYISFIDDILINGFPIKHSFLISPVTLDNQKPILMTVSFEKEIRIPTENLIVLNDDLELNKKGKSFLYPECVLEILAEQKISTRKKDNQIDFIRALLELHYDTNDPEKCRTLLNNGKLSRDFARKGIECNITGETLRNWLRAEF